MMDEIASDITVVVSRGAEILAAVIIGSAVVNTVFKYVCATVRRGAVIGKEMIRLELGGSIAVALEFLLGADVLATAVAPSWNDIGKLAAIAILRTGLNYFLEKELSDTHNKQDKTKLPTHN